MKEYSSDVLILGAGISGLMAAGILQQAGLRVRLLDKGRVAGGRMATRQIENQPFDYGAQFFTVREGHFKKVVDAWLELGIAVEWAQGFVRGAQSRLDPGMLDPARRDGHPRYRGIPGMSAIPKTLARGLDLHLETEAISIGHDAQAWRLLTRTEKIFRCQSLILTPPIPQSLALLDSGGVSLPGAARRSLDSIRYDPCLAMLVLVDGPGRVPEPGGVQFQEGIIRWIADNRQKGLLSQAYGFTLHASADFSREHWEVSDEQVAEILLQAAAPLLEGPIRRWKIHRWRYSQPQEVYPQRCLLVSEPLPLVFAGDAFGGPRVEGAAMSGLAAADRFLGLDPAD